MEHQSLFSLKDKSKKKIKVLSAEFFLCSFRVKDFLRHFIIYFSVESKETADQDSKQAHRKPKRAAAKQKPEVATDVFG